MRTRWLAALAAALVASAAAASAQTPAQVRTARAAESLLKGELTIFDYVTAAIEDGTAVLSGKVTNEAKKAAVERRVAALEGVREVRSEIAVLPVSRTDDELRYRISRAIYSHPAFWSYAAMPHPPIHIIVENGNVTLAGTVGSGVERAMARSLASGRGERALVSELAVVPSRAASSAR